MVSTAPSASTCDFISLNRSISVLARSFTRAKKHRLEVKNRHKATEIAQKNLVIEQAERNKRRIQAQKEGKMISLILLRKEKYEKMWLGLIFFAKITFEMHRKFDEEEKTTKENTKKYLATFKIQRNYHKIHKTDENFQLRQLIYLRNHIKLVNSVYIFHYFSVIEGKLMSAMRDSCVRLAPSRHVDVFTKKMIKIQREWRLSKAIDRHFRMHVSQSWDFLLQKMLSKQDDSKKKKKKAVKRLKKRKYSAIPTEFKVKAIAELMTEAVNKCREANKGAEKVVLRLSSVLPKLAQLKMTVKSMSKEIPEQLDAV